MIVDVTDAKTQSARYDDGMVVVLKHHQLHSKSLVRIPVATRQYGTVGALKCLFCF